MRKFILIAFQLFLSTFSYAQNSKFDIIKFSKNFVAIKSDLLISKFETSNKDFLFFLDDLKKNKKMDEYRKMYPDTLVWKNFDYGKPFISYYFKSPAYYNYPVVGVLYDAAVAYCDWLSDKYNRSPIKKYKKVKFCLPSKEEWILAASGGDTSRIYAWDGPYLRNKKGVFLANFKLTEQNNEVIQTESEKSVFVNFMQKKTITSAVNSYPSGNFGIYNICGNVAEMISEYGITKGGSFDDYSSSLQLLNEGSYSTPGYNIGFRVAMRVIEK